jgi:chaperonin GroEL (HSP60 family)
MEDALNLESILVERDLLGRVVLVEPRMIDPKIDEFPVRIASPIPLEEEETIRLKNELLEKVNDILGDGPDSKKVFVRNIGDKRRKTPKTRFELSL